MKRVKYFCNKDMRNKMKLKFLGLALFIVPALIQAKVMLVVSSEDPSYQEISASFKKSFSAQVEEHNLYGLEDEARKLGKSFVSYQPELLIVIGNLAAKMAKEYCSNCPVLYASASNSSLLKLSGAKVYGISATPPASKIVENIRLVFPEVKRVGLIYQPNSTGKEVAQIQSAATKAGLEFKAEAIAEMKEIPNALNRLLPQIELYLMLDDPAVITDDTFPFIFMNCFQKKIPIFTTSLNIVKKGALAGYAHNSAQLGSELASFANDILAQKVSSGREKSIPAKLFLNQKVSQMWNFTFPDQATSQATIIQ